jgi:hypothetical protein
MALQKYLAAALAASAFASGCAIQQTQQTAKVAWAFTYPDPLNEGKRLMTGYSQDPSPVGHLSGVNTTFFEIRECDESHTHCAHGVVKPKFTYTIQNMRDGKATLAVNVSYDVGATQSIDSGGLTSWTKASTSIPPGFQVINGHATATMSAQIILGEFRQIRLPNDVRLNICVAPTATNGAPPADSCDTSAVQARPGIDEAVRTF